MAIVTVDDGHVDAYRHIFPIAKAIGIPISLCIPTDFFFRGKWLWFDKVTWIMNHTKCGITVQIKDLDICTGNPVSFAKLRRYLKRCHPKERDSIIEQMVHSFDLDLPSSPPEEYRAVAPYELREMLSSGLVDIVGHTVTHTIATVLSEKDLDNELRASKQEWESFCGRSIVSFCYPNGNPGDFNKRTTAAIKRAEYRYAFTQLEGTNLVRRMDPYELKRVHIHWRSGVSDKVMSGLVDLQNRMCGRRRKNDFE